MIVKANLLINLSSWKVDGTLEGNYRLLTQELPFKEGDLYRTNWYFFGYLLHYVPFFLMGRVLYFHHFYSAFIFNCMMTGAVTELLLARCSSSIFRMRLRCAFLLAILLSFVAFAPLAYGIPVDENHKTYGYIKWFKWLDTWGF